MKLRFKKLADRWFYDFENYLGCVSDLEMVNGADSMLTYLTNKYSYLCPFIEYGFKDIIDINISIEEPTSYLIKLIKVSEDTFGATYIIDNINTNIDSVWICPVTLDVLNTYPNEIYIK